MAALHPRTGLDLRTLSTWMFGPGLRVLLVAAFAFAIIRIVGVGVKRFEHDVNFGTGLDALERAKRAQDPGLVLTNITTVVVLVIATLMILKEFNVDISPALTGAGIVGVALGFGSQSLVRDLIGGFFLILENQIRVGDVAAINGIGGSVEAINLRTTVLRDEEGTVHVIPNGAITTLANKSIDFSYYVVNLPLAYGEDTDEVAGAAEGDCGQDEAGGSLPVVHPRAAGGHWRRCLRAAGGPSQGSDQDGADQAVVRRTRVPAANQQGCAGARARDVEPSADGDLTPLQLRPSPKPQATQATCDALGLVWELDVVSWELTRRPLSNRRAPNRASGPSTPERS